MSRARVEFYATPGEQRAWLSERIKCEELWCYARIVGSDPILFDDPAVLEALPFSEPRGVIDLTLGNPKVAAAPVWRTTGSGKRDVDFVRSLGIQYIPSLELNCDTLLQGSMAIAASADYQAVALERKPLENWFARETRSFQKNRAKATVTCRSSEGEIIAFPKIIVTRGAAQWRLSGRKLKQFPDGPFEFDVQLTGDD